MGIRVISGLDHLKMDKGLAQKFKGVVGYLCHGASVDSDIKHGVFAFKEIFGSRFNRLFSPQHGFVGDVQDNMVESSHFMHPYFNVKVYSLYSETRIPTAEMLDGLDHIFVDLQDVGTRIYTYIYTMTLLMEACANKDIDVVILDRPNPINGEIIEGNILDMNYASFVGRHPLPVRHGMTMGEIAQMALKFWNIRCSLQVIPMQGWERWMDFEDTKLPWVMPSPNLPTIEAAFTFVGTVLYEGTNISEGRGTTRSLEIIGHPGIEPYGLQEILEGKFKSYGLHGFTLRPVIFMPTFQKHAGKPCGGYQIHVTDRKKFRPWRLCQVLCQEFYHHLGPQFQWKQPPYEYEYVKMPVDLINGTDKLRSWVEKNGDFGFLDDLEKENQAEFLEKRNEVKIY
ncbi:MAG: DUF1343 domain-containing protein [Bacteroidota bacterium]|nr:DUF1343 domain-containing protein [Bacteroidota bacterium]